MKIIIRLQFLLILFAAACSAQNKPKENATVLVDPNNTFLRQQLEELIKPFKATIGIAVLSLEDRDTLTINNHHAYPMQSVYKLPLAMAVLQQVDQGKYSLTQKVHINKDDLKKTWSPLKDKFPNGNINLTLAELLQYTISMSDNNTCDILFRLLGGTKEVNNYVQELGIKDMVIKTTEQEMAADWKVQYTNHSTPYAMIRLLDMFHNKKQLSDTATDFLSDLMIQSSNSNSRIKGRLPSTALVAHKTGSSGTNKDGLIAATNDVGIVTLPDGKHFAIAVFVSDSKETIAENEKIIALIAATVYNTLAAK